MNKLFTIAVILILVGCEEKVPISNSSQFGNAPTDYVILNASNYDSLQNDPVKINEVHIEKDTLIINLSYSGGCEDHIIDLARLMPWCGTPPLPPPTFEIRHNSKGDLCEAWITQTLKYDISPLQDELESPVQIIFQAREYNDDYFHKQITYSYE
ncbi:MAG TPA: NigD-like C-terminal domain-containing protein [Sunxiuqinia sp.]|nr:NigD-like C-terminal domain-containing protein [Sunxiuqinia sp.]